MSLGFAAVFATGQSVLYRGIDEHQRVISVIPVVVVQDDAELISLWMPLGVETIKPELIDHTPGTPRRWVEGNWYLARSTWRWAELLVLVRPGDRFATWVRWSAARAFEGWAVNFQAELIRTDLGFDVWDHQLDLLVAPDRRWQLKDEDELELSVQLGRMSADLAEAVRQEARAVIGRVERNEWPFCEPWAEWKPDPRWSLPVLPESVDGVVYR